jgi:hypothetical protein
LIVDNQVELEAIKPAHLGLAVCGTPSKDAVLVDKGSILDDLLFP